RSSSASRIATTIHLPVGDGPDRRTGLGRTPAGAVATLATRPCQAFSLTTSARAPSRGMPARAPTKEFLLALVPFPEEEVFRRPTSHRRARGEASARADRYGRRRG